MVCLCPVTDKDWYLTCTEIILLNNPQVWFPKTYHLLSTLVTGYTSSLHIPQLDTWKPVSFQYWISLGLSPRRLFIHVYRINWTCCSLLCFPNINMQFSLPYFNFLKVFDFSVLIQTPWGHIIQSNKAWTWTFGNQVTFVKSWKDDLLSSQGFRETQ